MSPSLQALHLILVGPDGQVVRYDGQAVPTAEALRAFLAHGWRPKDRGLRGPQDSGNAPAPGAGNPR